MDRVDIGSIVTRSDGRKYMIVLPDDLETTAVGPEPITLLSSATEAAKDLLGKQVGDFYYANVHGLNLGHKIIAIEQSTYTEVAKHHLRQARFQKLHAFRQRQLVRRALANFNFMEADANAEGFSPKKYAELKAVAVQKWFANSVSYQNAPYVIDSEQAAAIADMHYNTLTAARAGSGKTRTIVAKIIYLIAKYNISPDEFLVFVFNKNAAAEIND